MKSLFTLYLILIFSFSFGQSPQSHIDSIKDAQLDKVISMTFLSKNEFNKFIRKNIRYPIRDRELGCQGTSIVTFTISDKGIPKKMELINEISNYDKSYIEKASDTIYGLSCDDEVIRLIKLINWKPSNGTEKFELALTFKMSDFDILVSEAVEIANKKIKKGKYKSAINYLNDALIIKPYDVDILRKRAVLYSKIGKKYFACRDSKRLGELGQNGLDGLQCE